MCSALFSGETLVATIRSRLVLFLTRDVFVGSKRGTIDFIEYGRPIRIKRAFMLERGYLERFYDSDHVDTHALFHKAYEKPATSFRRALLIRPTLDRPTPSIRRCIFTIAAAAFGFTTSPRVTMPARPGTTGFI